MSEQEKLPACALCGKAPYVSRVWETVRCESYECDMQNFGMSKTAWRRLMARPRLAPEHVRTLKELSELHDGWTEATCAIRAVLAAMGEE